MPSEIPSEFGVARPDDPAEQQRVAAEAKKAVAAALSIRTGRPAQRAR